MSPAWEPLHHTRTLNLLFDAFEQIFPDRLVPLNAWRRCRCAHSTVNYMLSGSKSDLFGRTMNSHVTYRHSSDRCTVFEDVTSKSQTVFNLGECPFEG